MRQSEDYEPKGCFQNIVYLFYVAVFTILAAYTIFVFAPQLERHFESEVCQPETIVEERKSRGELKTVICIDKKTGRKINVSTYQFFQCCPPILIFFIALICGLFLNIFFKLVNKPKNEMRRRF